MSTVFNDNVKLKSDLNIYNIETDSLVSLSFNFDILKYVITELIKNQKNTNEEMSKIKADLLQQQKNTNEIESSLLRLNLPTEKNFSIPKNLEENKNKLSTELNKLKNEINNKENNEAVNVKEIINEHSNNNIFINKEKSLNEGKFNDNNNSEINNENNEEKNNNNINSIALNEQMKIFEENKNNNITAGILSEEIQTIINDIKNIKSNQLNLEKDFNEFKKELEKNFSKKIIDSIPNIEINLNAKIELMERTLNSKIKKNFNEINNIKEDFDKKNQEIFQKLSEKEVTNKIISELKGGNDILIAKVNTLNDNFSFYTKLKDFKQNKEDFLEYIKTTKEDINKNIEILRRSHNSVKNLLMDHLNDKTDHNNLDLLLKRFDIAQNMIYKFRDFQNIMEEKEKKRIVIDPNHFIDKEIFNDFLKNEHKIFDDYRKDFLNLKQDLEDLKDKEVGNKATLKDLKSLEDAIHQKIEELKQSIAKNFVNKSTLDKNKKIIEMQTKQLIEGNKKEDKKDNWLLSKKPFSGHLCASCESFIGELNPNVTAKYIPWNKYPQKDPPEKVFKIEGGTSKLLNLFSTKMNHLNNNYNKNNINCTSVNNSTNIIKTNNEENDNPNPNSRNSANGNLTKENKMVQVSSFSGRLNRNKNFKIKSLIDELENINSLPMIPKSIKHIKKNNSSFNLLNPPENMNKKNIKNMLNTLKPSNSSNNIEKKESNLYMRNIQVEDSEEFYLNSKKNNSSTNESRREEPKITKIIKKHEKK